MPTESASTSLGDIDKELEPHLQIQGPVAPSTTNSEQNSHPNNAVNAIETRDAPVAPDGGWKAWFQVFASFFLFFASWGFVNSFGAYQDYYATELLKGSSASNISWIGTIQAFLLMFVGVLTGPLYDKGYFRHLVCTGTVVVTFGIMMTSLSKTYWQVLLTQGVCVGLGTGCLFVPSVAVIAGYFTSKRSFATGLGSTGGSIGGIVYSVAFRSMVDKIGFGWTTRVLGFMTAVLLAGSISVMKPLQYPAGPRSLLLPKAFKELEYTFAAVALMITFMGLYIPYFHITGYAAEYVGIRKGLAYQLLTIMNAMSVLGRTIPTILADKIGPINCMIPSAIGTAVMGFAWVGIKSEAALVVFAILYGFLSGTVVSLPPTVIAGMGGKQSEIGTRLGMAFTFAATGLLTGNPMAGTLIDIPRKKFAGAQYLCGGLVTAGMLLFTLARFLMKDRNVEEGLQGGEDVDVGDEEEQREKKQ